MVQTVPRWLAWVGHGVLLFVALSFVVTVTYLPHMEKASSHRADEDPYTRLWSVYSGWANGTADDYEYFMHVDEPVHWVRTQAMQDADSLTYPQPYTGAERTGDGPQSFRGLVHEKGFYVAMGSLQEMTGVGWSDLIRVFPALWAGLTASLVWVALRPWQGAPLAAAFVALVPTSARFLGIGFFVPIGIGLAWMAAVLALSRRMATDRSALLLVLVMGGWSFFIHLIVGFATVLLILLTIPMQLQGERRNVLLATLAALLPLAALYDAFAADLQEQATIFETLPIDFTIFDQLGIPFLAAWVVGVGLLMLRPPKSSVLTPVVTASVASVLIFSFIVVNLALDLRNYSLYDRWHQPFALLASVPVAYGIVTGAALLWDGLLRLQARASRRRTPHRPVWVGAIGAALVFLVAGSVGAAVAAPGTTAHLEEPYYRVLNDADWASYVAARDLGPEYAVFLSHPWKSPAYVAMSGKLPYTWLDPGTAPKKGEDYVRYKVDRHKDGLWLLERDITVVLDETAPRSALYVQYAPGVWILDPEIARELHKIRSR